MSDALSPVAMLCLAILHGGEATGYEIKKASVEGDYRYFVDASYGSIYPALSRLSADGLVTVREETQSGRPSRKVYAVTDAGRRALIAGLSQLPGPDVFRSRFLLLAKFAELLPPGVIAGAVAERKRHLQQEIACLETLMASVSPNSGLAWVGNYAAACMTSSLSHLEAHGDALVSVPAGQHARGGSAPTIADAAE